MGFGLDYMIIGNWHAAFVHFITVISYSSSLSPSSIYVFFHTRRYQKKHKSKFSRNLRYFEVRKNKTKLRNKTNEQWKNNATL